jgi:hypothetical protein
MSFHDMPKLKRKASDADCATKTVNQLSHFVQHAGMIIDHAHANVAKAPGGKAGLVAALVSMGGTTAQDVVDALDAAVTLWNTHASDSEQKTAAIVQGDLP